MAKKILVAYATRVGSTIEVAEAIANVFREWGMDAEVRSTHERLDVDHYAAVVLGSAVRAGHLLPEAVDFLEDNRAYLKKIPVAYFVVCNTMTEDTEENRATVLHYFDPVLQAVPELHPISIGLFAGKIDVHQIGIFPRLLVAVKHLQVGDYRNWDAIRNWACAVAPYLLGEPEMLYP
jgi:menaquinone-dependent protoporphyrinogen oxidase